jgi:sialate O-acetylesterase
MNRQFSSSLILIGFSLVLATSFPLKADVKMPAVFGDHMVLQQEAKLPVWGWADPGETISVALGDDTGNATADAAGKWRVDLAPLPSGTAPQTLTVTGKNTLTFQDVLIGDVWLASGQSNMQFGLGNTGDKEAIAKADQPEIRIFFVPKIISVTAQDDMAPAPGNIPLEGKWQICTSDTMLHDGDWGGFSAVAFYFASEIHQATGHPVGVIGSYWGGTPAQTWTSLDGLQKDPELAHFVTDFSKVGENLKADAKSPPVTPTVVFNGMIAPLVPYALKGVIWYQGEANVGQAKEYQTLFPRLIMDWREKWGQGDFPFLFVQLAGFGGPKANQTWSRLQEAQCKALALPQTGMAVAVDIGDAKTVHGKDKRDVGMRLALAAKHVAYGQQLAYSGPIYQSMQVMGTTIQITFTYADGLKIGVPPWSANGHVPDLATELTGFTIAGDDQKWVPAKATIEGTTVIVSGDQVSQPTAVRYGWSAGNLYNGADLPASPFQTDDWDK